MPRVLFEALGNRVKGSLQYARDGCEEESTKITNADTKLMDDEASRNSTKAEEVPAAARRRRGGRRSCPTWRTRKSKAVQEGGNDMCFASSRRSGCARVPARPPC